MSSKHGIVNKRKELGEKNGTRRFHERLVLNPLDIYLYASRFLFADLGFDFRL